MRIVSKALIGFLTVVALAGLGVAVWLYMPVHIKVTQLEKVVQDGADADDLLACGRFKMTALEFEQAFARKHRLLFNAQAEDYGFGACYYKTRIGAMEYVIWQHGVGEIRDKGESQYYADSARKFPAAP